MKNKLLLLLVLVPMLFFSSCEEKNPMIGTWKLSAIYINGMDFYNSPMLDDMGCIRDASLIFAEDYSVIISFCDDAEKLTYTYADKQCFLILEENDQSTIVKGELSNNEIVFTVDTNAFEGLPSEGVAIQEGKLKFTKQ